MYLSIATKGVIGVVGASALGGASYGAYSYFNSSTSVKEELIKKQKTILNLTATEGHEDYEAWQELAKQYHGNKLRGKEKINDLTLSSADVSALQAKCKTLLDSNSKNENYGKDLAAADNWCTKENAPVSVTKLLADKKKVLLTTTDNTGGVDNWAKPWEAFKAAYKGKDLPKDWSFENWTQKQNEPAIQEGLKTKCTSNGGESLIPNRDEDLISQIISFCTKDNG